MENLDWERVTFQIRLPLNPSGDRVANGTPCFFLVLFETCVLRIVSRVRVTFQSRLASNPSCGRTANAHLTSSSCSSSCYCSCRRYFFSRILLASFLFAVAPLWTQSIPTLPHDMFFWLLTATYMNRHTCMYISSEPSQQVCAKWKWQVKRT